MNFVIVLTYCAFCVVVCAAATTFLRTWWAYFIVSSIVPPMILVGLDVVWRGYLDAWADIAFLTSWLIAFGCSISYYIARRIATRRSGKN
jgi:hypothetical protein